MAKVLYCKDVTFKDTGYVCEGVIHGETEQDILQQIAEHAEAVHDVKDMPEEIVQQVRAAIRDE